MNTNLLAARPDTIAAVATAPGAGGVGVIRISGPQAKTVLDRVFRPSSPRFTGFVPRMMHHGHVVDARGRALDDVLVVFFPGPHSFTGEDVAEIHGHGGPALLHAVLDVVLDVTPDVLPDATPDTARVRMAERGEFTRRAFLNGRLDLSQAEAVAELVASPGAEGARLASAKLDGLLGRRVGELRERLEYLRQRVCLAVDFPEEEGECLPPAEFSAVAREVAEALRGLIAAYERARIWREGALVALAGQVNAGKSSLMNALLGRPRAIVTERPGTTRDYLEEECRLDGLPVRLVDTAGLREDSDDPIEREGMRRGREKMREAGLVLLVLDGERLASLPRGEREAALRAEPGLLDGVESSRSLAVWNKADLAPLSPELRAGVEDSLALPCLPVSARTGQGLEELCARIAARLRGDASGSLAPDEGELAPNRRQARVLEQALTELTELDREIAAGIPPDLCGLRLDAACVHLGDVIGLNSTEETLNAIFADFCIGK